MDLAEREAISGRLSEALRLLISVRALDPSNRVLQARYAELSALFRGQVKSAASAQDLAGEVHLEYTPGKKNFDLRGDTQSAYNEIARQFGVEVAFDVDLRPRTVRFHIDDLDFPTAMRLLGEETGTFWRPLTKRLFLVAENTVQKRKDYAISVVRTVILPASETPEQMTEIFRLVREIAGITRADLDTRTGTITMRASPQAVTVASSLIENLENPARRTDPRNRSVGSGSQLRAGPGNHSASKHQGIHAQPPASAGSPAIAARVDRRYNPAFRHAFVARRVNRHSNRVAPRLRPSRYWIFSAATRRFRRWLNYIPRDGARRQRNFL